MTTSASAAPAAACDPPARWGAHASGVQARLLGVAMIRTGYLRWEIEVQDVRSRDDAQSREVIFLARPSFRIVRVKRTCHADAADRFVRGEATYDSVLRTLDRDGGETDVRVPDVGPRPFRYSESDRARLPRYWMEKLQREVGAFAHEVVRTAASFPQLVISSPALRAGYARLVVVGDLPGHRRKEPAAARPRRTSRCGSTPRTTRKACPSWSPPSWCATWSSPRNSTSSASSIA